MAKCDVCRTEMTSTRENYKYEESGLPYVTLEGVEVRRCAQCGEHEVVIPAIETLHRLLAIVLIEKIERFTGAEVKYLRKYLGLSAVDFADVMGVSPSTVSRWEHDAEPIGPTADRLLRMTAAHQKPVADYPLDHLARIEGKSPPKPAKMRVRVSGRGQWEPSDARSATV